MSKTVDLDYTLKHFKDTFEEFPGIDNSGLDDSFSRYYQTAALLSIAEDLQDIADSLRQMRRERCTRSPTEAS